MAFGIGQNGNQNHDCSSQRRIDDMSSRQHDRLARHTAIKLQERNDRTGEGDCTNRNTQRHFDQRLTVDLTHFANAERMR